MNMKYSVIAIMGLFRLLGHNSTFKHAEAAPYEQPTGESSLMHRLHFLLFSRHTHSDTIDIFQVQPDDGVEYTGFASPNASFPAGHDAFSQELYDDDYKQKWDGESFISDDQTMPIKDDFSPSATDGGQLPLPPMDDLIIVVEYPLVPTSQQQQSIQHKSEQQPQKEVVGQQHYISVPAVVRPIYASEKAVRFSPQSSQQKVNQQQQQYISIPAVGRPIYVGEKAVQFSPSSNQQKSEQQPQKEVVGQQQYISIPAVGRPIYASEKAFRFSPPSSQQKVNQQPQSVPLSQQKTQSVPLSQQQTQSVPLSQQQTQSVPPVQQQTRSAPPSQQHFVDVEHSSVGLSKQTGSGKKKQEVKLAHNSERYSDEASVKYSFCKRRPDGFYRHPNDCSRILQVGELMIIPLGI